MASSNDPRTIELKSRSEPIDTGLGGNMNSTTGESDTALQASLAADSTVPDGGYGWVVIFGCSVITWWFVGTTYSWGLLQASLIKQNLSSPSTLSFVGSLTVTCIAVLALVNARVIRALGARNTGLLGVSFGGMGEILSGFSTRNIGGLFVTTGVIMGIGTRYVSWLICDSGGTYNCSKVS